MFPKVKFIIISFFLYKAAFALTLEEAVNSALENGSTAKIIDAKTSSIEAEKVGNTAANFLPDVSLYYNKYRNSDQTPQDIGIPIEDTGGTTREKGLEVRYTASNIYKGSFNVLSKNASLEQARYDQKNERKNLMLNVAKLYFNILEIQKKIELYKKSLAFSEKLFQSTSSAVKRGSIKRTSLYIVESQVEEIKAQIALTENDLEVAKNRFLIKVKRPADNLQEPQEHDMPFNTLQDVLTKAREKNFALKANEHKKKAAKYNVALASSTFLPEVSLGYKRYNVSDEIKPYNQSQISLGVRLYLYKPGLIAGTIKQGYDYRASKYDYDVQFKEIENEVKDLWSKYIYYNSILKSKQRIVNVRRALVKDLEQDYNYGRIEITDKLEEEKKLIEAEIDLINTRFQKILNVFELKAISGVDILAP
jgi:outer membrane protein TolC